MDNKSITYSYTAGTLAGGLVEAFKLKKSLEFLKLAHNITQSAIKHLTKE